MRKIHCLNPISSLGTDLFTEQYEMTDSLKEADGVLVRSASMHELELPDGLRAIARAGAGVNNIPLKACSERGIVVFNTPGANANGVKELVLAGLLLAARDIVGGIGWCREHKETLNQHFLYGTGTTARMINMQTGLPVRGYNSGPLGGDMQIGAQIVEGNIDFVIFFSDPLTAQPHDPDVKALLRIAQVYDIPIANNKATADFLLTSSLMDQEYAHEIINFQQNIKARAETL